jgi:hypothetical protein
MERQMANTDIDIQNVLAALREIIGLQAQEIAVLKATIAVLKQEEDKV